MTEKEALTGHLLMVVAPSGAGKSTLVAALLQEDPQLHLSISYTTRPPRPGEVNGREYHFIHLEEFLAHQARGEFVESANVHGHYYATSRLWLEAQLKRGHDVVLEIDWQGAQSMRSQFSRAVGVFILPPSLAALEERLYKRGQDTPDVIERRLRAARDEIAHAPEFDFVIINDAFEEALMQLHSIVTAARLRFAPQQLRHAALFAELGIVTTQ